jgi:outer membrane protein OmpA-like peptidoglycan-associated protein
MNGKIEFTVRRLLGSGNTVVLAALVAGAVACGGEAKPPAASPASVSSTSGGIAPSTAAGNVRRPVGAHITVTYEIYQACHLDAPSATDADPKFAFDESLITRADAQVLDKIAACLTTGPLSGRHVMLTGRADPRGTEEYNLSLGARRAHSVGKYLEQLGVAGTQVNETSRGALDATGGDEAAWAVDRRVDIALQKT